VAACCWACNLTTRLSSFEDSPISHGRIIWQDSFPTADLHFYSQIYHDWPLEKCRFLTQKSFESLEPGGRIIIHEMLYNDDKTGPFPVAAFNIVMLLCTEGQQYSGSELWAMLREAGFTDIEVKPTWAIGVSSLGGSREDSPLTTFALWRMAYSLRSLYSVWQKPSAISHLL